MSNEPLKKDRQSFAIRSKTKVIYAFDEPQVLNKVDYIIEQSGGWTSTSFLPSMLAPPLPLRVDAGGAIRIGKTRVTLQTLVGAFNGGATAEAIVQQFPTLDLAETYLAIGYYLQHRTEVDEYIRQQKEEAAQIQAEIEARPESVELHARLLAHRQSK